MTLRDGSVLLTVTKSDGSEYSVVAEQVIAAVPPRLLAKISFTPDLTPDTLQRWRDAATWMAPHAKFIAAYERPFWREAGLSGRTKLRWSAD